MMDKKVLITGGSGLVGSYLTTLLIKKGYRVAWLSSSNTSRSGVITYNWDIRKNEIDVQALENAYAVIHLAGASVADGKWTSKRKKLIIKSRTKSAQLLYEAMQSEARIPEVFVSASAIGIYPYDQAEALKEEDSKGDHFLAEVSKQWEEATDKFAEAGIRTAKFRIGVVLSKDRGALPQIAKPIRYGVGAPIGSGKQMMSWIDIEDLCNAFIYAIEAESFSGVYNAVTSHPVSNKEMTKTVADVLGKPLWLPNVPEFVIKSVFGEKAEIILRGQNVSNEKLKGAGFQFKYDDIYKAVEHQLD
jgi:uncharacterized protein (TIGR01777 family)